jgi:hypothetical protein
MPAKPQHRSGYRPEETDLVVSACLTMAVTLGAFMDQIRIVGGFAPSLLIDHQIGPDPDTGCPNGLNRWGGSRRLGSRAPAATGPG